MKPRRRTVANSADALVAVLALLFTPSAAAFAQGQVAVPAGGSCPTSPTSPLVSAYERELADRLAQEASGVIFRSTTPPMADASGVAAQQSGERQVTDRTPRDPRGVAVATTTIEGLILVRDMYVVMLRAMASRFDQIRESGLEDKRKRLRELVDRSRELDRIRDELDRRKGILNQKAQAVTNAAQAGGTPYHKRLLEEADAARAEVDAQQRVFDQTLEQMSKEYPELVAQADGGPLWDALDEPRMSLSDLMEAYNKHLTQSAKDLRDKANEAEQFDTVDELWKLGSMNYSAIHDAVSAQGAAMGSDLPRKYMDELQQVFKAYQLQAGVDAGWVKVMMAGMSVILIPVAPLLCAGISVVDVVMTGNEVRIAYKTAEEAQTTQAVTGQRFVISSQKEAFGKSGEFIVAVVGAALDLNAIRVAKTGAVAGEAVEAVGDAARAGNVSGAAADVARPLSTAEEYTALVARQAKGEMIDLTQIARPGIAKVTPNGEILVAQGAGRWEKARPDDLLDIFIPANSKLPDGVPVQVLDKGVPAEVVQQANLLSSRGEKGTNPIIVNASTAGTPEWTRVRVPAKYVDAPTSGMRGQIGIILDELREAGTDVAKLEKAMEPLSPAERLALLNDPVARAQAIATGTVSVPARVGDVTPTAQGAGQAGAAGAGEPPPLGAGATGQAIRAPTTPLGGQATNQPTTEPSGAAQDSLPRQTPRVGNAGGGQAQPAGEGERVGDARGVMPESGGAGQALAGGPGIVGTGGAAATTGTMISFPYEETVVPWITFGFGPEPKKKKPGGEPGQVVEEGGGQPEDGGGDVGGGVGVGGGLGNILGMVSPDGMSGYDFAASGFVFNPPILINGLRFPGMQNEEGEFKSFTLKQACGGTCWENGVPPWSVSTGEGSYVVDDLPAELDLTWPGGPEDVTMYITSTGNSTGEAFELVAINRGREPVTIPGGALVLEPVKLDEKQRQKLEEERAKAAKIEQAVVQTVLGYCLEMRLVPPAAGTFFRIAAPAIQQRFQPAAKLMQASRQLHESGQLHPDSPPEDYFHSVRQWALWVKEQGLTEESFADEFVKFTRKNVEAAGQAWTKDIEKAVRELAPNRWRDIQRVLQQSESANASSR